MLKLPLSTGRPHSDLLAVQRIVYQNPDFVLANTLTGDECDYAGLPLELELKLTARALNLGLAIRRLCQRLDCPARLVVLWEERADIHSVGVKCFAWMLTPHRHQLLLHSQIAEKVLATSGWNPQEPWTFSVELQ